MYKSEECLEKYKQSRYLWLLPSHGNPWCSVWSLMPLSCLFLVSALPLCHWQGVEKLVHYFSDKAWYSTISDFFLPPSSWSLFAFLFSPGLHDACQSVHAWDYRHVIGGSISIFLWSIKVYSIITVNSYVAQKMILGISCVLCSSILILE